MTFSIAALDRQSGALGCAVTSSSICVASRCAFVRAGAGTALSQNVTDPRLGQRALALMADGLSAAEALGRIGAESEHLAWRQLALVDHQGGIAWHSGAKALGCHAAAEGQACVALGNLLADPGVPAAMIAGFEGAHGHLAGRLIAALEAGLAAGGEDAPVRSAGVLIADRQSWPVVDLRVDWHEAPVAALRALWQDYAPQLDAYVVRALDPDAAPAF
jgi:uncharacterized Ntn-hydrolase superfamily protein